MNELAAKVLTPIGGLAPTLRLLQRKLVGWHPPYSLHPVEPDSGRLCAISIGRLFARALGLIGLVIMSCAGDAKSEPERIVALPASPAELEALHTACGFEYSAEDAIELIPLRYHNIFRVGASCTYRGRIEICAAFAVRNRDKKCTALPDVGEVIYGTEMSTEDILEDLMERGGESRLSRNLISLIRRGPMRFIDLVDSTALMFETRRKIHLIAIED